MTLQQKDEFIQKLERTALITAVTTIVSSIILSIGLFVYIKFQTAQNVMDIEELKIKKADAAMVEQIKTKNDQDHADLKLGVKDLQAGQHEIYLLILRNSKP